VAACVVVVLTDVSPASAAAGKLDGCTFVSRAALEHAVGNRFATAHDSGDSVVAAGCHFPSRRTGGTDLGLYVSADVRAGIRQSYEGRFFATEDGFRAAYGDAQPLTDIVGTDHAYTAFQPGALSQGAFLALDTQNRAVLVVLVGEHVNASNTVSRGQAVMRLAFAKLPRAGKPR
jgi:hypothetical protein